VLSYAGATRTLKVASQSAVNAPGTWFASNSGTTVTVTVYSTSTPGAQYSSIILDWQTCVRVTAARVTINNIMAINGYVGFHYVGSVNAQGFGQYAFQNSGDGFRFDTGAHGCVHWSPTARENGIAPDEGPEGFRVGSGSATSIDVWGGELYNPVSINNGEDGFLGGITPGGAWRIFNANFTANHENAVDLKGGSFEFYGGIFDQRGTFTTLSPVTLHQNAPNAQFYDLKIYGRDELPLSAQGGIGFDQGATGTIVRCEIWCGASSGILCQPASGGISVIATTVWKQAVGSTISPIRFQNDATHPATHVLKNVTLAGNAAGGVPLSMVCLQGDAAGVSGSSINCLWNNPTTVATSRACVVMTGAALWTSTNDLYYKGEPTEVARATSKLSATQVAAGITNGPLTISGAVVGNPQLDDINVGDLRPHAGGLADNAGTSAANVFADRDNVGFGTPPDIGALRAA
jgi:hypothetical protein